jgi:hypothetical protein
MRRYFFLIITCIYVILTIIGILDRSGLEVLTGAVGAFISGCLTKSHWKEIK